MVGRTLGGPRCSAHNAHRTVGHYSAHVRRANRPWKLVFEHVTYGVDAASASGNKQMGSMKDEMGGSTPAALAMSPGASMGSGGEPRVRHRVSPRRILGQPGSDPQGRY